MDKIEVEGIRLYGYHGCLHEESQIGTEYLVNVTVWGNLKKAAQTDDLTHTLDYVMVNKVVEEQLAQRAKLIEVVAQRIINGLFENMPLVKKAKVKLTKMYAPINGDVEKVSVVMKRGRS